MAKKEDNSNGEVVEKKEEEEEGEKKATGPQAKLDMAAHFFRTALDKQEMQLMFVGGSPYIYKAGVWRVLEGRPEDVFAKDLHGVAQSAGVPYAKYAGELWRTIRAVLNSVSVKETPVQFDPRPLIVCPNGTLDVYEDVLLPHSPDHYCTRQVAIEFDPDATCPEWERMLRMMLRARHRTDADVEKMAGFLQEWVGVNIVGPSAKKDRPDLRNGLFFEGGSGTGKSSFADIFAELFGRGNIASPSMADIGSQFGKESLCTAQALISEEGVSEGHRQYDTGTLKKLISGESIMVQRKYQAAYELKFSGAVLFTGNNKPVFDDNSRAMYRRILLIPFLYTFSPEDRAAIKNLTAVEYLRKIGELPGVLNWALEGFVRAVNRRRFEKIPEIDVTADTFRSRNDPVFGFLKQFTRKDVRFASPTRGLVDAIGAFANHEAMKRMSPQKILEVLRRTIEEVYPEGRLEPAGEDGRPEMFAGIRVNAEGLAWYQRSRLDKQGTGEAAVFNVKR